MTTHCIQHKLQQIDIELQSLINRLIEARQSAKDEEKQLLSYVSKKVDVAGKAIGMALERMEDAPPEQKDNLKLKYNPAPWENKN